MSDAGPSAGRPRAAPEPLADCPGATLAAKDILLTDVDDTLTRGGRVAASTLAALERLEAAGIDVIPITGACAGWGDHIARAWPVAGVIAESGAIALRRAGRGLERTYWSDAATLAAEQQRVLATVERLQHRWPLPLAGDQPFRIADVALDHAQEAGPFPAETVAAVIRSLRDEGFHASASSIHVNVWIGDFDKRATAGRCLRDWYGLDAAAAADRVLFVGDAPNDEPLFAALPDTVGVANIAPHLGELSAPPRWLTRASHGAGVEELAGQWLQARSSAGSARA